KGALVSTGTRSRGSPLLDITSVVNQLQSGASTLTEEAQALRYHALLAEARAGINKVVEHQPQNSTSPKAHRGGGYTLRHRMELVKIFRHLSKNINMKVTATNFHQFVNIPVSRKSITQWDKDFDKIQFD
ncbi:hypothetical protein BGX23_005832, partial [Mortierella sp. AD031]